MVFDYGVGLVRGEANSYGRCNFHVLYTFAFYNYFCTFAFYTCPTGALLLVG